MDKDKFNKNTPANVGDETNNTCRGSENLIKASILSINTIPRNSILTFEHNGRYLAVKGRPAQTLFCLCNVPSGITAIGVSTWALRLSAYIHILRTEYGLNISTVMEKNDDIRYARYKLHDGIEIIEIK